MSRSGYAGVKVEVFFDLSALDTDGLFVVGASTLSPGTDVLAGDVATDITSAVYDVAVTRGRSRELDAIQTGTCRVRLRNYDGNFLPDELNSAGAYLGQVLPGKRVRVSMLANDAPIFVGRIDEWRYRFDGGGEVDAEFEAVDAMGQLASMSFNDWTTTAGDLPGERIEAVLDRAEVDWGPARSIGDGVTTLQSDEVSWGSNVLNYCSLVAATDRGFFFASRDGLVTYLGRDDLTERVTLHVADPSLTLVPTDDGSGIPFTDIQTTSSSELLFNRVGVDREGGALQTVSSTVSQSAYGVRSLQVGGLLMETDEQAARLAGVLLGQYSEPQVRASAVSVVLDALDPADEVHASAARFDLGDVVCLEWTPTGGTPVDQLSLVEGVEFRFVLSGASTLSLSLSPTENLSGFIIGNDTFGVIGTSKIAF